MSALHSAVDTAWHMLENWYEHAEGHWHELPGFDGIGHYGSGYNEWGVQTNQKFAGAMCALANHGHPAALRRAVAALRFHAHSHVSGRGSCSDGSQWGHTWISTLGIERMMYGVNLVASKLDQQLIASMKRVALSEAEWLLRSYERYYRSGIRANLWDCSGENHPESNIWNGAHLWRTAAMYPDSQDSKAWRDKAHEFLVNGVSVPGDLQDPTVLAGKPVRDRCVGANFFPAYGQDHRGYMNLGYMLLCVSNAAILHFDLRMLGVEPPETLYRHQKELWAVIRRMIFSNGRLARIGGDARVRYAYCHDYMLPSLLFAADALEDPVALALVEGFLSFAVEEQEAGGDGSFYGSRLAHLAAGNPYYYTRLEADRACGLAMFATYAPLTKPGKGRIPRPAGFESSVRGGWTEPEHGSVLHRSPTRFASFAWRAFGLTQGLCLPPDQGHLAEWDRNLAGSVQALHTPNPLTHRAAAHRRLEDFSIRTFPGGFVTWGSVVEGVNVEIDGGWQGTDSALHRIVFAALPDDHTVVGFQHCRTAGRWTFMYEEQGLHLNIPNDLFNGYQRRLEVERGPIRLESPAAEDMVLDLGSRWLNVDGHLGVIGIYGADSLTLIRHSGPLGGPLRSLRIEEIAWYFRRGVHYTPPAELVLDVSWMIVSSIDARTTREMADSNQACALELGTESLRAVRVHGLDGKTYIVAANFSEEQCGVPAGAWLDLVGGDRGGAGEVQLLSGEAKVFTE